MNNYSIEIENSIIGAILLKPEYLQIAKAKITQEDFYNNWNKIIFRELEAIKNIKEIDVILLAEKMKNEGVLKEINIFNRLMKLAKETEVKGNISYYINQLLKKTASRKIEDKSEEINNYIKSGKSNKIYYIQNAIDEIDNNIKILKEDTGELEGIINIRNIKRQIMADSKRSLSGFKEIDRTLEGFRSGDITVWTGKSGSGKSTILGQIVLHVVEKNKKAFVYSGELTKEMYKEWLFYQANGSELLMGKYDKEIEKNKHFVTDENYKLINNWINGKVYLYDEEDTASELSLLDKMKKAHKLYGIDVFIIDNLMRIIFNRDEKNFFRQQSNFVNLIKCFAKENKVHVHLVAHPRKTNNKIEKMDISGSGDITNLADNVIGIERISGEDAEDEAELYIMKNRWNGETKKIKLEFDKKSKRYYSNDLERRRKYSWKI